MECLSLSSLPKTPNYGGIGGEDVGRVSSVYPSQSGVGGGKMASLDKIGPAEATNTDRRTRG